MALYGWDDEDSVDQLYAKVDPKQRKGRRKAWMSTAHALAIIRRTDEAGYEFRGSFEKFMLRREYDVTIPWRKDDDRPAKRYEYSQHALDRAERHDDPLNPLKLMSLLGEDTPSVKRWKGRDGWIRTTQWRAVENEEAVPANRKPCVDG